jgi:hypothetical protein
MSKVSDYLIENCLRERIADLDCVSWEMHTRILKQILYIDAIFSNLRNKEINKTEAIECFKTVKQELVRALTLSSEIHGVAA